MHHVVYDTEIFPNLFTMVLTPYELGHDDTWVYEISERHNGAQLIRRDIPGFCSRMYGFNNLAFDYPLLHHLFQLVDHDPYANYLWYTERLFHRAQELIAAQRGWENYVKQWDVLVEQVDLLLINHFDNPAKMTSLKTLEFNMQSPSLEEMPFPIGHTVALHEIPQVLSYNTNDTRETKRFAHICKDAIDFREKLIAAGTFGAACINWNDAKIGEQFFISRLEEAVPGITKKDSQGRKPHTYRPRIALADVIVPYVSFERPELKQLLQQLKDTSFAGSETKNAYKYKVNLDGFEFDIGQGGIHGSVEKRSIRSDANMVIIDIDVTGYYPSVAIVNGIYPNHIGPIFCEVYRQIRDDRSMAKKAGDVVKAGTLKLAGNGGFGKTGSPHSVLFDPQCLIGITINGQLLQCVLAEALLRVPGLQLLQMNTDGLSVYLPRQWVSFLHEICGWWERQTCLELEFNEYQAMWLRDVNNYLALDAKGKMKRKGAYDWEMLSGSTGGQKAWNRDFSALVVPKAAEAALVHDHDPGDFIGHHDIAYDFLLRAKVNSGSRLILGHTGEVLGKTVRYYVSTTGQPLVKVMPPLKGNANERRIGIHAEGQAQCLGERKNYHCSMCGERFTHKDTFDEHNKTIHAWPITVKNQWDGDLTGIDYRWYVNEAERLLF
jgi:hypothetical protein